VTSPDDAGLTESDHRFAVIQQSLLQRWPEDRISPTLDRVALAVELLGDPHRAVPVIHIAGTNGKTTTARMVDALLRAFGLSTGRFTSPHLETLRERIVLNGEPISTERFVEVYDDIAPYLEMVDAQSIGKGGPAMSTFEVLTVLALAAFVDAPVDVAVIEVGMGGTWDATNVVDGAVSVICPVGFDHMDYLGDSLEEIAGEKAGIIPADGTAVIAGQQPEAAAVILRRVLETGSSAMLEGVDFGVLDRKVAVGGQLLKLRGLAGEYDEVFLPLHGAHHAQNAAMALAAVESFLGGGAQQLDAAIVREGFGQVTSPGRLEVVRRSPTVVVDAAHNPEGVAVSVAALREAFDPARLVVVLGVLADKDVDGILDVLVTVADHVVVTEPSSPRRLAADDLGDAAARVLGDERVQVATSVADALEHAVSLADDPDLPPATVLVVGSVVLAGQVRMALGASGSAQ
jgi:dihydrofolate synthase/folylpolyglutamate synthase